MITAISFRAPALVALAVALALTGCARPPQRLDLIPLEGQPLSRAVIDQRECETEFPYTREEPTLQAYAACLIARGYVSEVPLSASSGPSGLPSMSVQIEAAVMLPRSGATSSRVSGPSRSRMRTPRLARKSAVLWSRTSPASGRTAAASMSPASTRRSG